MYIVSSAPGDEGNIICFDLVLLMGWVDSPKFFCAVSETLTDMANALVDTKLYVPSYSVVYKIPVTGLGPPHTQAPFTPRIASPISIFIWMTSSQQCWGDQIANTKSFMAQSLPSSGSSRHYQGSSKTQ